MTEKEKGKIMNMGTGNPEKSNLQHFSRKELIALVDKMETEISELKGVNEPPKIKQKTRPAEIESKTLGFILTGTVLGSIDPVGSGDALSRFQDLIMDGYGMVDNSGRFIEANETYQRILGYTLEEMKGLTYKEITPSHWDEAIDKIIAEQLNVRGYSDVFEKEYIKKDGTVVPIEMRASQVRSSSGEPLGIFAVVRDITERKKTEKDLAVYKRIIEESGEAIGIASFNKGILYLNPASRRMLKLEPEQTINFQFDQFQTTESQGYIESHIVEYLKRGETWQGELDLIDLKGHIFPASMNVGSFVLEGDTEHLIYSIGHDISEQKQFELSKVHIAKLQAAEEERARLSMLLHDHISHLLVSAKYQLEHFITSIENPEKIDKLNHIIEQIIKTLTEIRKISRTFMDESPISDDFDYTLKTLINELKMGEIKVTCKIIPIPQTVSVKIQNVVIRIMEETISNIIKHSSATHVDVKMGIDHNCLQLEIKDNGTGMACNESNKGEGLKNMRHRAESVGGQLNIETARNNFTRIHFKCPLVID